MAGKSKYRLELAEQEGDTMPAYQQQLGAMLQPAGETEVMTRGQ